MKTFGTWLNLRRRMALPLIAALATGFGTFTLSPRPAHADMFTPSVSDQIKLGDQAAAQIEQQYRVLHDDRAAHLEDVGHRILDGMKNPGPWHWTFHLIDSKEVNAFALPGGNVFFFSGLFDKLHDDNALAAVLGHEMTHVTAQHWAHMEADSQKRQVGLLVLLGITRANSTWRTVAGLGDSLLNLKYSRKDEEQADLGGLQKMSDAGYDPNGMIELFHILQQSGGGGGPEFLSDHPLTSHRIAAAKTAISRMGVQPIN